MYDFYEPEPHMDIVNSIDLNLAIYKIKDGRYYSVQAKKFVSESSVDENNVIDISMINIPNDPLGEVNLRQTLEFYKLPVGNELLTLDEVKKNRLALLSESVDNALVNGKVRSSLGFVVDATEKAIEDTNGLIKILEASGQETVDFCDANNGFHTVTLDQVKTINIEIINYKQSVFANKWSVRRKIEAATTKEAVEKISIEI